MVRAIYDPGMPITVVCNSTLDCHRFQVRLHIPTPLQEEELCFCDLDH